MIENPTALLFLFLAIVFCIHFLARLKTAQKIFRYLPVPFWCYFMPAIFSTLGLIPPESPLYPQLTRTLLPACLILILTGTSLAPLIRLSRHALVAMIAGSFAIFCGGIVSFFLFFKLGESGEGFNEYSSELWKGWGCLSASWTGGSANMIAVKEILKTPEVLFSNLILVDAFVAYGWMAFLILLSKYQERIDNFLKCNGQFSDALQEAQHSRPLGQIADSENIQNSARTGQKNILPRFALLLLALTCGQLLWYFSSFLPLAGAVLNRMTWTVIGATILPILISTKFEKKLSAIEVGGIGYFLLYLMLTSMGAKANISSLLSAPIFIVLGFVWILTHGTILLIIGKFFHIPFALLATASQANVGGPVSAPIVAVVYNKNLAPVAVLLAVLGGLYGTIAGIAFAEICRKLSNLL